MSGSERTVAALVVLGLMVVVAEGWVGNFRDWVRATVGAQPVGPTVGPSTTAPYQPGTGNGAGAVQPGQGLSGQHGGTTSYPTF